MKVERSRWLSRSLELVPGLLSWAIIVAPAWLLFSYPWLIAWFIIAADAYWLSRGLGFAGAVLAAHRRIGGVLAEDWRARLDTLERRPLRREELLRQLVGVRALPRHALGFSAFASGAADRRRARAELADLDAIDRLPEPPSSAGEVIQVAVITIGAEPLDLVRGTMAALAEADWPVERKICAVITRADDERGPANAAALRAEFGEAFADVIHLVDRLEPGVVSGGRSALAFAGRELSRMLVRGRGIDPGQILVTDLGADYRVHPQYFSHLAWRHLTDGHGGARLYRPIPFLHNDLWSTWMLPRLFASIVTQLQMAGGLSAGRLPAFGPSATTLELIHEVGYWATDALPTDARFSWKSYFAYGHRFRVTPLFIPVYGDARRARTAAGSLVTQYLQGRRWARGVADFPYVIENAVRRVEIPRTSRAQRVIALLAEHATWAIAPFAVLVGSTLPLLLGPPLGEAAPGSLLVLSAVTMLAVALTGLAVLVWVEYRIAPPQPAGWGRLRRGVAALPWIGLPILGVAFSILPAHDLLARTPGRPHLEERGTKEA